MRSTHASYFSHHNKSTPNPESPSHQNKYNLPLTTKNNNKKKNNLSLKAKYAPVKIHDGLHIYQVQQTNIS